jgi:hypothetical protein
VPELPESDSEWVRPNHNKVIHQRFLVESVGVVLANIWEKKVEDIVVNVV